MADHFSGSTLCPPLLAAARAMDDQLKDMAGADPTFLSVPEKTELATLLVGVVRAAEGLLVDTLAVASDVADEHAARHPGSWLAHAVAADPRDGSRWQRLAEATITRPVLREGLRAGVVSLAHGEVVAAALDALGSQVSERVRTQAEEHLVSLCPAHTPGELRKLGRKVLEVLDPDTYEAHEREQLEKELAKAEAATRLTITQRGDGASRINAVVPDHVASRLKTYLEAFCAPRHDSMTTGAATGAAAWQGAGTSGAQGDGPLVDSRYLDPVTGRRLKHDRVLGEAFCAFLEAADPQRMPIHGGAATTVVVTIDLEALKTGLGTAVTDTGEVITAGEARRLACQASILPAVLGGESEVLDLGRTKRLFSTPQRRAIGLRQHHTCIVDGCTVPAAWCEAHHDRPWVSGGKTDLANGVLVCPRHHRHLDDGRHAITRLPGGGLKVRLRT